MKLRLVKEGQFIGTKCDFYVDEETKDIYMTRRQIGEALEYANPTNAMTKLHSQYKDRLDKMSIEARYDDFIRGDNTSPLVDNFPNKNKKAIVFMYNEKGIYEILRHSNQPLADDFFDYVYEMLHDISHKGYYLASKKDNEWLGTRERGINMRRRYVSAIESKMLFSTPSERDDFIELLSRNLKIHLGIPYNPDFDEYHQRDSWTCEQLYNVMCIEEEMCDYIENMEMDGVFGDFTQVDKVNINVKLREICNKYTK